MPIYEYAHDDEHECDEVIEEWQKITDKQLTSCPNCGKSCHRILSRTRGKVLQELQYVYEDDDGYHTKRLSANRDIAKDQMKEFHRDRGENPEDYETII